MPKELETLTSHEVRMTRLGGDSVSLTASDEAMADFQKWADEYERRGR